MPRKLALVTGASSGIGAATAERLAREGWSVVLVARSRERLDDVARRIGPAAHVECLDAADGEAVIGMAARIRSTLGVPDLIVNAAGAGAWKRIEETSPAEARAMMGAPYFAAFHVVHAFMRDLLARNSGVIVHVGSPGAWAPWPSSVGYAGARWALRGLHEALCADLSGTGVHSCHVLFGKVESAYFDTNENTSARMPGIVRLARTITPDECAEVIVRTARRPRRTVAYPPMARVLLAAHTITPWFTRWLMRTSGYRPVS